MRFTTFATFVVLVAGTAGVHAAAHAHLTDSKGMTLYTFDKDSAGTSVCYDDCAVKWPPYLSDGAAAMPGLSVIERKDGTRQWAKDGKPLYFWMGDTEPGETNGDGVGGVWHVAR